MRNIFEYHDEGIYLEHHGILGQKWGIRRFQNRDGSLTAAGKKRYGKVAQSIVSKAKYNEDISGKVFKAVGADDKYLARANDALQENYEYQKKVTEEVDKMFKGLRSEDVIHFYEAASEIAEHADYYGANGDVDNMTVEALGQVGFHGVLDDGQQGVINAYSMYAAEHNLGKKVDTLERSSIEHNRNSFAEAREYLKQGLGEVGLEDLPEISGGRRSMVDMLATRLLSTKYNHWDYGNGAFYLDAASHASRMTEQEKHNIAKAASYVRKINASNDQNTWWYVSQAAENLGMTSTQLKNMTQSDWDRINQEIAQLKKNR